MLQEQNPLSVNMSQQQSFMMQQQMLQQLQMSLMQQQNPIFNNSIMQRPPVHSNIHSMLNSSLYQGNNQLSSQQYTLGKCTPFMPAFYFN